MSRYLPPRGYELIEPRPRHRAKEKSPGYDRHAAADLYNDPYKYASYEEIYPGYDSHATSYDSRQSTSRDIYQDYQYGSHGHHGQHHGGSHLRDAYDSTTRREGKRPAYETSTSQRPRHQDSGRGGGHRGNDNYEQMLQDQMLAMSLQQQEDEASLTTVLGEPHQHHGAHHHSGSSREYSEYPRSRAHRHEYGEPSNSSFGDPGRGGRHRRHEDVPDPHLDYYDTMLIAPQDHHVAPRDHHVAPRDHHVVPRDHHVAPRDHHGGSSKSSSRKKACVVCMDNFPEADLYKLCPGAKCPLYCADCTKRCFKTEMKSLPKRPVMCCNKNVSIDPVAQLFRPRFVEKYKAIQMEFDTEDKLYCSKKKCSAFIPPASIIGANATCQKCGKQTCTRCKNASHQGKRCRSNPDDEKVKELGYRKGWQPCPGCQVMTAKNGGCLHIKCTKCGTDWCYNCGRKDCDTVRCRMLL